MYDEHLPGPWREYDFPIMFFLKSGKFIKIHFENEAEPLVQCPGMVSVLPPFRKRRIELIAAQGGCLLDVCAIGLSFRLHGNIDLLSFWKLPILLTGGKAELISSYMYKLVELKNGNHPFLLKKMIEFHKISLDVLSLITSETQLESDSRARLEASRLLEPAVKRLRKDFRNDITVMELAECCHMSKTQFFRKFKAFFGTSPIEYQQHLRFSAAKGLLLNTNKTIAEIAEECGWNDSFHFSRIFKKHSNFSPTVFRRKYNMSPNLFP